MKLSFIGGKFRIDTNEMDGLGAALELLLNEFEFVDKDEADIILVHGAVSSDQVKYAAKLDKKKILLVAGADMNYPQVHGFDKVLVETPWHIEQLKSIGVKSKIAFGTNTDLYRKISGTTKQFDYIYPAAYAAWKRHDLLLELKGKKIVVGHMQEVEKEIVEACKNNPDTTVLPIVSQEAVVWLYNQARYAFTTPEIMGGGERTILESYACGIEAMVYGENKRLVSLVDWVQRLGFIPDHHFYADRLREAIYEVAH